MCSSKNSHTWAFVGLGNMGGAMALNLGDKVPQTDTVMVYDSNDQAVGRLQHRSGRLITQALDLAEIGRSADTIMTCLPTPAIAGTVIETLLKHQNANYPSRLIIDFSTIDLATSRGIARAVNEAKLGVYVDAPMSGGVVGAQEGTLSFMVGSTSETFARVEPVLATMGKNIVHCGPQASGLSAKLANNYLLAINNLATAEAMNFGIKAGLDPATLTSIVNSATGRSWSSEINNPVPGVVSGAPASRGYKGGFSTALMNKDLILAIKAAEQIRTPLILSEAASRVYGKLASDKDYAFLDFSSVYKYLETDVKSKL